MGIELAIAAVGLGVTAFSAVKQMNAQSDMADAQQRSLAAQQKAEDLRRQQMELDATRRKREQVRASIVARSTALSRATNQGATGPGSSGILGGEAQIAGQTATNVTGINQNLQIGEGIFDANRDRLSADRAYASSGAESAMWSSIGSLSGTILKNTATITRIGESLFKGSATGHTGESSKAIY